MMHTDELVALCSRHTRPVGDDVVIREAYVPYLPPNWNGVLVLAESQNLSIQNGEYVRELEALGSQERMTRLRDGAKVGIAPWDDGSLKLAVESALGVQAAETAVSNAVCWSRRGANGANASPTPAMSDWAVALWRDLLPILRPTDVVAAGKVAQAVLAAADPGTTHARTTWRLPSPQAMSRVSGMFRKEDLLTRYPEVGEVAKRHPEWASSLNNIFFACHATSIVGSRAASRSARPRS